MILKLYPITHLIHTLLHTCQYKINSVDTDQTSDRVFLAVKYLMPWVRLEHPLGDMLTDRTRIQLAACFCAFSKHVLGRPQEGSSAIRPDAASGIVTPRWLFCPLGAQLKNLPSIIPLNEVGFVVWSGQVVQVLVLNRLW